MDILKAFKLLDEEHTVNIQGTYENPLFRACDIGKILGIKKITDHLKDFTEKEKGAITISTLGGPQETIFLTEIGLYKFIGRSRKPIAQTFQSWIINVIKEIRISGFYKLNQEKEVDKKLYEQKCNIATHNTLLKAFDNKNVVYILKMKQDEENSTFFIIKIGSTQNIKQRLSNISKDFNSVEPQLLDIFQCDNHIKFENVLHNNEIINKNRYNKMVKCDGKFSREMYIVNNEIYNDIIATIENVKQSFSNNCNPETLLKVEELRNENENIILKQKELELKQKEIVLKQKELDVRKREIDLEILKFTKTIPIQESVKEDENIFVMVEEKEEEEEEKEDNEYTQISHIKKRNNGIKVPRVYQYSPDDLKNPIKIFDSPAELERSLDLSQSALKRASRHHTIYRDYRWIYVNRNEHPPVELEPTQDTKHKSAEIRFIAMIDIKQTKILAVYASQKDAIEARNMKCNSFTRAIQQKSISSGHYWNFFDDCSKEMKQEYLKTNSLPEKRSNPMGQQIQKIDPTTQKVVEVYHSKRDVVKKCQISYLKINSMLQSNVNEIYNGFIWKKTESS